jgi:rhamnosyltransferase
MEWSPESGNRGGVSFEYSKMVAPIIDSMDRPVAERPGERAVCAVIVSYYPVLSSLRALVESVAAQVAWVVIVDNGSPIETLAFLRELSRNGAIELVEFGENRGIAAAHNAGIRRAMENSFEYVLLLDHDSRLLSDCVRQLRQAERRLTGNGVKVAAVGPQYVDETSGMRASFWRFFGLRYSRVFARGMDDLVEASVLISSGSLIACATLQVVGLMDEALFIDGVDWEWCFRATKLGYRLFGVASANMQHSLGDSGLRIFGRTLPLHSPLRHYYVYRNQVLLCGMKQIPFSWKFYFSLRLAIRFVIYMALAPERMMRCKMVLRGLRDGFRGRDGRLTMATAD